MDAGLAPDAERECDVEYIADAGLDICVVVLFAVVSAYVNVSSSLNVSSVTESMDILLNKSTNELLEALFLCCGFFWRSIAFTLELGSPMDVAIVAPFDLLASLEKLPMS